MAEESKGDEDWTLPASRGKSYNIRLLSIYNSLWNEKYGFNYRANIGRFSKLMKELCEIYEEAQVALLMVVFFNWKGLTGDDEFEHQKVQKASFNVQWFGKAIQQYEIYARNVLKINLDDPIEVKRYLAKYFTSLHKSV